MRCFILSKFYRRNFQFVVIAAVIALVVVVVAGFAVLMSLTQKFLLKLAALLLIIWNELFFCVLSCCCFFVFPLLDFPCVCLIYVFWFLPGWIFQWTTMIGAASRSVYTFRGAFKMNEIAINWMRFDWGKRGDRGAGFIWEGICALVCDFDLFVIYLSKVSELFASTLREMNSVLFLLQINSGKSKKIHISFHCLGSVTVEFIGEMYTERNMWCLLNIMN